jgi:hypothetical protein
LFKIPTEKARQIANYTNANFYIILSSGIQSSVLYSGSWVASSAANNNNVQSQNRVKDTTILDLNKTIQSKDSEIALLKEQLKAKDKEINDAKAAIDANKTGTKLGQLLSDRDLNKRDNLSLDQATSIKKTKISKFINK